MARKWEIDNDRINECIEKMCEDYCIWPEMANSDESLRKHCEECPINNILIDEYWERTEEEPEWERDEE